MLKSAAIHGAVLRARLGLIFIIIILQSTPVFCCVGPFSMGLSFSFLCAHVPSGLRYKKKTQKNFLPPATTRYHPSRGSLGVTKASLGVTSRHHPPRAATGPSPGVTGRHLRQALQAARNPSDMPSDPWSDPFQYWNARNSGFLLTTFRERSLTEFAILVH